MSAVKEKKHPLFEADYRRSLLDIAARFKIEEEDARVILLQDSFFDLESQDDKLQSKACMALRLWLFHAAVLCEKMANGETLFSVVDPKFLVNLGDGPEKDRFLTEGSLNGLLQARRVLIAHMNQLDELMPESSQTDPQKYAQEEYLSNAICAAARWATVELEDVISLAELGSTTATVRKVSPWSKMRLH